MSAHKTAIVRLGEAEYRRLRAAEEQLRLQELQKGEPGFHSGTEPSIFERMRQDSREREREFEQIVSDLGREAAQVEQEAARWVQAQSVALQAELEQVEQRAGQNAAAWYQQVAQEMEQRQQEMDAYLRRQAEQLSALETRRRGDEASTRERIEAGQHLLEHLQQNYPLDLQSANELEYQRETLAQAVELFNTERYDLAWVSARQAVGALTQLRHRLEAAQTLHERCYQDLLRQAAGVYEQIAAQQRVNAMDADGNELPERVDVSFWTQGDYQALVEQAGQALRAIQSFQTPDLNEMAEWKEELNLLSERALEQVTQARLAVLASQLRFNVAQIVVQALESQGFYLEGACYNKNDYRGAFVARTRSLGGSEVLVTIDPDPGLEEGGRLQIESSDAQQVTEHELLQRNREIFQAIQDHGLLVTRPATRRAPAERATEAVRQRIKVVKRKD